MTATVIKLRQPSRLECSACGAAADAACDCGLPYVPAGARAAAAVAASPEKSDRAIADELGVGRATVQRARKSGGPDEPPERRIGKDGKSYKAQKTQRPKPTSRASDPIQEECADCDTAEQYWQRSLSNLAGDAVSMRAFWTREFGKWEKFEVPSSLVTLAKQAAKAWTKLATDLVKQKQEKHP